MAVKRFRTAVSIPVLQGTGNVDTTQLAADSITAAKIDDGAVVAAALGAGSVETAKIADDAVTNPKLESNAVKFLKFQYDFDDLTGAQGAITLTDEDDAAQTIPDNACIVQAYVEGLASSTSGGSATYKLGISGDDDCFIAATAFNNGEFDAEALTELSAGIPLKTTAAVSVLATIATADITAGKFNVRVEYYEGD